MCRLQHIDDYFASFLKFIYLSAFEQAQNQHFNSVILAVMSALTLSWDEAATLLARFQWDLALLADSPNFISSSAGSCVKQPPLQKSYLCLTSSLVDLYTLGLVNDSAVISNVEVAHMLTRCESCARPQKCGEMYALRCRHYRCCSCWSTHIERAVLQHNASITCLCNSFTLNASRCGEQVGLDLISRVCGKDTVSSYLRCKIR